MGFGPQTVPALRAALVSHALTLGVFDRAEGHEPKSAPGAGVSYAVWLDAIDPLPAASGLAAVSGRIGFRGRVYLSDNLKSEDLIDPRIGTATGVLFAAYSAAFTLGGAIRNIDLLGEHGPPLAAQAAWMEQDTKVYRVMEITIPLIVNDLWDEVP